MRPFSADKKGAIIFDFDGTLANTLSTVVNHTVEMIENAIGRPVTQRERTEDFVAHFDHIFTNFNISDQKYRTELIQKWGANALQDIPLYSLFPGIESLLHRLKENNFSLYVWTARDRLSTTKSLEYWNVLNFFSGMHCYDDGGTKPDPRGISKFLSDFDMQKVVMIGDSFSDLEGASNLGCHFLGAAWDKHCSETVKQHNFCKDPQECFDLILKLVSI